MARLKEISANMAAFLDMIAFSEIGAPLLKISDDGYNVLVGSTPRTPLFFHDYSTHPNVLNQHIPVPSTAAGRYQFLYRYWDYYRQMMHLPDFGPQAQDRWAIQYIRECHAIPFIEAGRFDNALTACNSRWASLPGNKDGQHQQKHEDLLAAYTRAGGRMLVA